MPGPLRRALVLAMAAAACQSGGASAPRDDLSGVDQPKDEGQGGSAGRAAAGGTGGSVASPQTGGPDAGPTTTEPSDAGGRETDAGTRPPPARDGAVADSAPSMAPGLGAAPTCASGKALVCEDFEATAVGAIPAGWTRNGTIGVVAEEPARGAHSLKVTGRPNTTFASVGMSRRLTLPGAQWGRIYYRVNLPAPKPASGVIHATFVAMNGTRPSTGGGAEYRVLDIVVATSGRYQFLYNVQPNGAGEFGKGTGFNYSFDGKWQCAEWALDPANQSFHFYLNGNEVTQLAINNGAGNYTRSDIPNTFTSLKVGETHYQNSASGFVLQFDELAIDGKRIGCN